MSSLLNPAYLFAFIWSSCLILHAFAFTSNIKTISASCLALVLGNIGSFLIINHLLKDKKDPKPIRSLDSEILRKILIKILLIWIMVTIVEILYSQGLPILWKIQNSPKNYTDFGIPSLHGIANALFCLIICILNILFHLTRQKKYLAVIAILALWPVIAFARGILISTILQSFAIYLIFNKTHLISIIKVTAFSFIGIVTFGILGDSRLHASPYSHLVHDPFQSLFSSLPSGFLWV